MGRKKIVNAIDFTVDEEGWTDDFPAFFCETYGLRRKCFSIEVIEFCDAWSDRGVSIEYRKSPFRNKLSLDLSKMELGDVIYIEIMWNDHEDSFITIAFIRIRSIIENRVTATIHYQASEAYEGLNLKRIDLKDVSSLRAEVAELREEVNRLKVSLSAPKVEHVQTTIL